MSRTDQLRDIVSRVFELPPEAVIDELSRNTLEAWSSFNHLLLISEIEAEMGVEFTSDEVLRIESYKDLREVVANKR